MKKYFDIIEKATEVNFFNFLLIMILLIDYYLLKIFKIGFFDIDFNGMMNPNIIKHVIILLLIFEITYFWLSELLFLILYKIWARFFYKRKNNTGLRFINELKKISIDTNNKILMDYIETEENKILIRTKRRKIVYTLLIFIILNCSEKKSIVRNIFKYLFDNNNIITKLLILSIILLSVYIFYTIYCSIAIFDDEKIYYEE